jgi:hypothetical protein
LANYISIKCTFDRELLCQTSGLKQEYLNEVEEGESGIPGKKGSPILASTTEIAKELKRVTCDSSSSTHKVPLFTPEEFIGQTFLKERASDNSSRC